MLASLSSLLLSSFLGVKSVGGVCQQETLSADAFFLSLFVLAVARLFPRENESLRKRFPPKKKPGRTFVKKARTKVSLLETKKRKEGKRIQLQTL